MKCLFGSRLTWRLLWILEIIIKAGCTHNLSSILSSVPRRGLKISSFDDLIFKMKTSAVGNYFMRFWASALMAEARQPMQILEVKRYLSY